MADGSCQEKCHSNVHCPKEHICFSDGTCKLACNIYKQTCPSGQYCHINHRVCHDSCTSDKSCQKDYKCSNGSCYQKCKSTNDMLTCTDKQFCTE